MDGLTAKVFRTYNASITLQQQLKELTSRKHPPTSTLTVGSHPQRLISKPNSVEKLLLAPPPYLFIYLFIYFCSPLPGARAAFSFRGGRYLK